jgi:hypothetical protein
MCTATNTHQLALRAFTAIKREGQNDFWLPIGAEFAHERGHGFNLIPRAPPLCNGDVICESIVRNSRPRGPSPLRAKPPAYGETCGYWCSYPPACRIHIPYPQAQPKNLS